MDGPERLLTRPFVLAILVELGVFLALGMLLPVLPLFAKDELDAGSVGIGLAVAAVSPTALLFQPFAGLLGDRRGRRLLVVTGPLILTGTICAYSFVTSLWALVAIRLVGGLGEALLYVGGATIVTDLAPVHRRGEALSLYSLGLWGGLAIGPVLGETMLGDGRYDAVWLTAAGLSLLAAALATTLPETRPRTAVPKARSRRLIHQAALTPGFVLLTAIFGIAGFNTFVALYARELGLDGAGPLFFLFSGIVVGVRLLGRRLPDRLGARRAAASAIAFLTTGLLTIGLWNQPLGLYVGTSLFALGAALAFPALMTFAISGASDSERSSVVGTFSACADVGFSLGALTLGGVASLVGYDGVFVFSACLSLVGALVLARLPGPAAVQAVEPA